MYHIKSFEKHKYYFFNLIKKCVGLILFKKKKKKI